MPYRIYISGPMTGLPGYNYDTFNAVAKTLRNYNLDVVNPAELCNATMSWERCMQINIAALMSCNGIVMLDGWQQSKGAKLELSLSQTVGIKAFRWLTTNQAIARLD